MQTEQAVGELEAALRLTPHSRAVRLQLAAALLDVGRAEEAVHHYHALARAYRAVQDYRSAMAVCHSALAIDPRDAEVRILLSQIQAEDSQVESKPAKSPPGVRLPAIVRERIEWGRRGRPTEREFAATVPNLRRPESHDDELDDSMLTDPGTEPGCLRPSSESETSALVKMEAELPAAEHAWASAAFPSLPDGAAAELAINSVRRKVAEGELLLREGEPGDECYVVLRGELRVLKRDPVQPRIDQIEIARLTEGALFGEFALLSDCRRHATVQATEECEVMVIPRHVIAQLSEAYPGVAPTLEGYFRRRLLRTLVATAPFFGRQLERDREKLLEKFYWSTVSPGVAIIEEGEGAGGFFLIVLGTVEITKRVGPGGRVLLATLCEGCYFGEMSLLRGDVSRATVTAVGPVELAALTVEQFYEVIGESPVLWEEIRDEAHQRELATFELVSGALGVA